MKTILALVVALVLGALPVYFLACAPPKTATTAAPAERECPDFLGEGPRYAVVLVMWDARGEGCMLKTVPNKLDTCLKDKVDWETVYVRECADYTGELAIEVKNAVNRADLVTKAVAPGKVEGEVTQLPTGCDTGKSCTILYSVTLPYRDDSRPPLVEDPRIDIW